MKHEYELKAERFKQTVYRMSKIVGDGYLKGVNGQDLRKIEISIGATKPDETGMRRLYLKLFATNGFATACARLESTAGREAVNADAKGLRQNMFGRAAVVAPKAFLDAIRAKIRGLKRDARLSYDDETGVLEFEGEQVPTELVIGDNPLSAIFEEEYAVPGTWKYLYQCSGYCWDNAMKRYEAEAKRKWNLTPTKFARTASAVLQTIDGNLWIQAQKDDDRRQCVERLDAIDLKEAIASESAPANLFEPARFNYEMLCELVKFANPAKDFVRICRFKDSLAYSFYNSYRCQSYEAVLIALEDAQSIETEPATARDRVKANGVNDRPDARCASPANTVSNANGGEPGSSSPKPGPAPSPAAALFGSVGDEVERRVVVMPIAHNDGKRAKILTTEEEGAIKRRAKEKVEMERKREDEQKNAQRKEQEKEFEFNSLVRAAAGVLDDVELGAKERADKIVAIADEVAKKHKKARLIEFIKRLGFPAPTSCTIAVLKERLRENVRRRAPDPTRRLFAKGISGWTPNQDLLNAAREWLAYEIAEHEAFKAERELVHGATELRARFEEKAKSAKEDLRKLVGAEILEGKLAGACSQVAFGRAVEYWLLQAFGFMTEKR